METEEKYITKEEMTLNEYQGLAQRTSNTQKQIDKEMCGLLGLNGEVRELTDLYKKHLFQGHPFETIKVIEELGDILWYLAEIATALEIELNFIADANITKLKKRYPNGFETNKSINRL